MTITEIKDILEIRNQILEDKSKRIVSNLNLDSSLKMTSSNGYRIFRIDITEDDEYMEVGEGCRIYTAVNPRFKDTKCIVVPLYIYKNDNAISSFCKTNEQHCGNEFSAFIGNKYINIYGELNSSFDFSLIETYSFLIIMDMLYNNRRDALQKLIMITEK